MIRFLRPVRRALMPLRQFSTDKDITYVNLNNLEESPESAAAASHFFEFQTGRFLQNDRQEREKRATKFDLKGLVKLLQEHIDVTQSGVAIKTIEPLFEGKHNKLYKIVLQDERSYVLRIPYALGSAEYRQFRLLSEVATMEYIDRVCFKDQSKFRATLPLAYSATTKNAISSPFILSSFVGGEKFATQWKPWETDMSAKLPVIEPMSEIAAYLLKPKFPAYGSIYFAKDLPQDVETVKIDEDFVIGPSTEQKFWENQSTKVWGPWKTWQEYLKATADVQLDQAQQKLGQESPNYLAAKRYAEVVPKLFRDNELEGDLASPRLFDPDLSPLNIISQDNEKFWLIDVENSVVKPYVFHGVPWFVRNPGERVYRLEDVPNYEQLPEQQKSIVKHFLSLTQNELNYEKLLKAGAPSLIYAHHPNLKRREEVINRAMNTDITTGFFNDLDYSIFKLTELWPIIHGEGDQSSVPLTYTEQEINEIAQSIADWNQKLMRNKYLESNGFVPAEEFDQLLGTGNLRVIDDKVGNYELTEEFLDSQDMTKSFK